MSSVIIAGDTSGSVTLSAPAVSGTTTLTLPATSGTIVTSASSLTTSQLPAGTILQVLSTTKSDTFSSATTGSWIDVTGLTVSITPASVSNKIMVFARITGTGTPGVTRQHVRLVRDSTAISVGDASGSRLQVSSNELFGLADDYRGSITTYLDSPSSSSSITYKLQVRNGNGNGTIYVNRTDGNTNFDYIPLGTSSITVMEVKG
jgi:hypothetical protein